MAREVSGHKLPYFVLPAWMPYLSVPFFALLSFFTKKEPLVTLESLHAVRGSHRISHQKAVKELDYKVTPAMNSVAAIYQSFVSKGFLQETATGLLPKWKQRTQS